MPKLEDSLGRVLCSRCEEYRWPHNFYKNRSGEPTGWCKECRADYQRSRYDSYENKVKRGNKLFPLDDDVLAFARTRVPEMVDLYEGVVSCIESSASTLEVLLDGQRIRLNISQIQTPLDQLTDTSSTPKSGPADN